MLLGGWNIDVCDVEAAELFVEVDVQPLASGRTRSRRRLGDGSRSSEQYLGQAERQFGAFGIAGRDLPGPLPWRGRGEADAERTG